MTGLRWFFGKTKMVKDGLPVRLSSKLTPTASSSHEESYEDVVRTLNSLQTNAAVLQSYKKQGRRSREMQNVEETRKYLSRTGVTMEQLDSLSVIHVSGTKGKGTTCAFCESILRYQGFKTGFYSSPHLVAVRERIRINGEPLPPQDFSKYFWPVYSSLHSTRSYEEDMPAYFKFLTVMAFNVFLAEKVDVAIVEVGIGGEYDCTNVLRNVGVVGITSLGMDHTSILGSSIEDIAWQKAGIMKPGAEAFTVLQPPAALSVLQERAIERNCSLHVVPPMDTYDWSCSPSTLQLPLHSVAMLNASLALQLAHAWLKRHKKGHPSCAELNAKPHHNNGSHSLPMAPALSVSASMLKGLRNTSWPGRFHILHRGPVTYFLDGAHTPESISVCAQWFQYLSQHLKEGKLRKRVLVFNVTGERDVALFLKPLLECAFDVALFCPNIAQCSIDDDSDQTNHMVTRERQFATCRSIQVAWEHQAAAHGSCSSYFFPCVADVLSFVETEFGDAHVLVTGSLHLVGCVLGIVDPELTTPSYIIVPS